jgi:hypothetical protein
VKQKASKLKRHARRRPVVDAAAAELALPVSNVVFAKPPQVDGAPDATWQPGDNGNVVFISYELPKGAAAARHVTRRRSRDADVPINRSSPLVSFRFVLSTPAALVSCAEVVLLPAYSGAQVQAAPPLNTSPNGTIHVVFDDFAHMLEFEAKGIAEAVTALRGLVDSEIAELKTTRLRFRRNMNREELVLGHGAKGAPTADGDDFLLGAALNDGSGVLRVVVSQCVDVCVLRVAPLCRHPSPGNALRTSPSTQ